jgi:uncharacterized membrane protein YfhO
MILVIKKKKFLIFAAVTNMIVMTFLSMPFTLISQHKTKEINAFINSFPQSFPLVTAWKNVENKFDDTSLLTLFGYKNFYTKAISIQDHVVTPTINSRYGQMLKDSVLRKTISDYKFAYSDNKTPIDIKQFSPNSFSFIIHHTPSTELHFIQQYNRNWHAYADGYSLPIQIDNIAFMKVVIPDGANEIKLVYRPIYVIIATFISIFIFLACIYLLIYFRWIKK